MLLPIVSLVIGLIVLVWSADKFILGAAGSAKNFGMSPLLIGLTIVAFGTSAPEILVAIVATMDGSGTLAIGNALGSNIANIALVLGVTALIAPLPVKNSVRKKELPFFSPFIESTETKRVSHTTFKHGNTWVEVNIDIQIYKVETVFSQKDNILQSKLPG